MKRYFILVLSLLATATAQAQAADSAFKITSGEQLLLTVLLGIMLLMMLVLLVSVVSLFLMLKKRLAPDSASSEESSLTFWEKVLSLRPISAESRMTLSHAYDGIKELDNPTPPWFNYLFYGTIVFGIGYLLYFHVMGDGQIMHNEYQQEIALAEKAQEEYAKKTANAINESNVTLLKDAKGIAEGKALYTQYCVACHGAEGQGGVGPNLTDEYWLHGGSIKDVFKTVKEGVPAKGMIAWKSQLKANQIQQVSSFILSLQGTKPAGGKEPQGEKYAPQPEKPAEPTQPVALN